jgi:hypothetical protein
MCICTSGILGFRVRAFARPENDGRASRSLRLTHHGEFRFGLVAAEENQEAADQRQDEAVMMVKD